ncbi:type IV secretion system DNA-binding domain-containing protein [Candidatus Parcubacteria bacterium]|nr:type IV secretion system DNA-binding domain-containing protein [Candidatus Parcubacteria bacterium]HPM08566.1 type IV secretion system DNA-binding domain-containing protein [Candidatus Pacearchaeota archaeon]
MEQIILIGKTSFRNQMRSFGIKQDDRRRHMYIIGKTGMGKTVLLRSLAIQDIRNGNGLAFIDPHGDVAEELLNFVPKERVQDVVYFNPADTDFPFAFNVMEDVKPEQRHLIAGGLMGVFKKIWPDVWSGRMEYILNNCILALLEYPGATLIGINWMLSDVDYRQKVVDNVTDPVIKNFWTKEYARYSQKYEVEAAAAIQNKIGQFISNPLIRNIVGQQKSSVDMRNLMDEKKILILNLSKGKIGEDNSRLLGALLVTKLYLAAMSRVDLEESKRNDFYLYVDEFQNFATEAFINILSEARKYRLCLILAHQYINQVDESIRDAIFGNVGTMISFRVGAEDGEWLNKEFAPYFEPEDFANLTKYNIYLKLMIDGVAGKPFSAVTLPPDPMPDSVYVNDIIEFSRYHYATPKKEIDEKISEWAESLGTPKEMPKPVMMYDAKCSSCGKETSVPFKPDGKRPIYCKTCMTKIKESQKDEQKPQETNQQELKDSIKEAQLELSQSKKSYPQKSQEKTDGFVEQREEIKEFVSLKDFSKRESTPFFAPKQQKPKEKTKQEVNEDELGKLIQESLQAAGTNDQEPAKIPKKAPLEKETAKKGILRPGQGVKF